MTEAEQEQYILDLRTRNGELRRAFDNLDHERCFLRERAKRIRELCRQVEQECRMYEGQNNETGPIVPDA